MKSFYEFNSPSSEGISESIIILGFLIDYISITGLFSSFWLVSIRSIERYKNENKNYL